MRPLSVCLLGGAVAVVLASSAEHASANGPEDVRSVFFVSKSENKNQVHYGVHLDERCAPAGDTPVFAYWRMFERGAHAVEALLDRELAAYGLLEQHVLSRGERGGVVRVVLRALPSRPVLVTTFVRSDTCAATASLVIDGTPATLASIHAKLRWPFGVDHLLLSGRALSDGRAVTEKISP
jgi:hypothetical protein